LSESEKLQRIVSLFMETGYQLDKGAFDLLRDISRNVTLGELEKAVRDLIKEVENLPERPIFINRELIEERVKELIPEAEATPPTIGKVSFHPYAKEIEPDVEVIMDPTDEIQTTCSLEDYIDYFRDRFRRMSRLLRQRMDVRDSLTLSEALKSPNNSKVRVICMVTDKRETRRGIFLEVEDLETNATVYVPSENGGAIEKARTLLLDQVVCLQLTKGKGSLLIVDDVFPPDIPIRKTHRAPIPVYAALISDLHVGSKMFMEKEFRQFISWLNGRVGDRRLRRIASHVKYLIIAGDIVDGVGIYPKQIEELSVDDIYEQYRLAVEILKDLPDYIEVIVIPGNHDASRRALPQPALLKDYAEPLYELEGVSILGNPSTISLHGVRVLIHHGRSLDDVISFAPNMDFQEPDKAMKLLLQSRHLAPIYGGRTLIAPERKDLLVIEEVPDIYHAGHVHVMSYSTYRDVLLVNSGAWQEQTEYQREMGHTPNPGVAPIVNLQNLQVVTVDFTSSYGIVLSGI